MSENKKLMCYDALRDEMVEVTQEWVDEVSKKLIYLSMQRADALAILNKRYPINYEKGK